MLTYRELVQSRFLDVRIWESVQGWIVPSIVFSLNWTNFPTPIVIPFLLWIRSQFPNQIHRVAVTFLALIISGSESFSWFILILLGELARFILIIAPLFIEQSEHIFSEVPVQALLRFSYVISRQRMSWQEMLNLGKRCIEFPGQFAFSEVQLAFARKFLQNFENNLFDCPAGKWLLIVPGETSLIVFLDSLRIYFDRILIQTDINCPICQDDHKNSIILPCGHGTCLNCFAQWFSRSDQCPLCRRPLE